MGKSQVENNAVINRPIDKKARQLINKEIAVAQLGRSKVKGETVFMESNAMNFLDKHLRKKKKMAPVHFLVDRIRFTKKGFHEYLSYREILHFHLFPHRPDVFMLYTIDEKKGKRSYESYQCGNADDVQYIRSMIYTASSDPRRVLLDSGATRRLSVSSSSSSEYYIEKRENSRVSMSSRPITSNYSLNRAPSPNVVYTTPQSYERCINVSRPPSMRHSQVAEDVTYLKSDNVHGPQIMDQGPVYMYVSRSRQNVNRPWSGESLQ